MTGPRRVVSSAMALLVIALVVTVTASASQTAASPARSGHQKTTTAKKIRIGYLSGGDADPFVFTVTTGIRNAAKGAGVYLFSCDANFDDATAVACARTMATQHLDAVINWQFNDKESAAICKDYGNLPTVAMDSVQKPCEKIFVGANNHTAGLVAGKGLGRFVKAKLGCKYDLFVIIENLNNPSVTRPRAAGSVQGFRSLCGPVPGKKLRVIDVNQGGNDRLANVNRQMTDILTAAPQDTAILIMGVSGDADAESALAAANTAGRGKDVYIAAHGADSSSCHYIRQAPQWVGDVGYFPENYGPLAVRAAIALAKHQKVKKDYYIHHAFVNKADINKYYPACS